MELEQAIEHLLDGDAILFTGAGFSDGVINLNDKPFFQPMNYPNIYLRNLESQI